MTKRLWSLLFCCIILLGSISAVAVTAYADPKSSVNSKIPMVATMPDPSEPAPKIEEGTDPNPEIPPETGEGADSAPEVPPETGEETDPAPEVPPETGEGADPVPELPPETGEGGGPAPEIPPEVDGGTDFDSEILAEETVSEVDTTLDNLSIACGQLVPAFSPDVYEYTVYVTAGQTERSCAVEAVPRDATANISVTGEETFDKEGVTRIVTVSGNTSETTYTIRVHLMGVTELFLDGVLYTISETPDLSVLPEKFTAGKIRISDEDVSVVQSGDGQLVLAQFTSQTEGAESRWYRYDTKTEKFLPVQIVEYNGTKYVQIAESKDVLYGNKDGQGVYYIYDKETGEWIYQTGGYKAVPVKQAKRAVPLRFRAAMLLLAVWALAATAGACFLYLRCKKSEAKSTEQLYFRPCFKAVDEENKEVASEERTK